jgi:hypothetical protein
MKSFEIASIQLDVPAARAFDYIAAPENLPNWTSAFRSVDAGRAVLETPQGSVEVALQVDASRGQGTIDWSMTFPDGNVAKAFSRLTALGNDQSAYAFILTAPPVPLEQLEGALNQQAETLRGELERLRGLLESR